MKALLPLLFVAFFHSLQAQSLLQSGIIVEGDPVREFHVSMSDNDTVYNSVEFLSIDNYRIGGTRLYFQRDVQNNFQEQFIQRDTVELGNYTSEGIMGHAESPYLSLAYARGLMIIGAGLSHRTALPIRPIVICSPQYYVSILHPSQIEEPFSIQWQFSPEGIEYHDFDPRYVGYVSAPHSSNETPRMTGVFNRFEENDIFLDVYDIRLEQSSLTHKLLEIQRQAPFFINHVVELERKLLVSGYEVNAATAFVKQPKALLVDLEEQSWFEYDLSFSGNNVEVISGLLGENGSLYFVIRETDIFGELVESRITRYDDEETIIASFGQNFVPNTIIEQTNHGVLLGGDYDRFGLKTAALFEVEQYNGLKRMIGYADLGNVETQFKHFEETILGDMILGSYDSLNGSSQGSFMTPLIHESLLSVDNLEQTYGLISLDGNQLYFLEPSSYNYQVVDATGRIHLSGKTSNSSLSLSKLTSGFYAISVWDENKNQTLKTVLVNH